MGFLGALITFASRPFYTPHFLTTAVWGLTPLQDQQLGGAIMWVPGCIVFLVISTLVLWNDITRVAIEPASAAGGRPVKPPLSYLSGFGAKAYPVTALTWGLLTISILAVTIVTALVLWGTLRPRTVERPVSDVPVARHGSGLGWLGVSVGISAVFLLIAVVWTMAVLAKINAPPPGATPLTIEITGQQWWWKARYLSDDPSKILTTANEIHIPVGRPIRVKLIGADVIHSFWVPALAGKTDTIPGQTNDYLAGSREARTLSRPMHGILRPAACAYGVLHRRGNAGCLSEMAGQSAATRGDAILAGAAP